MSGKETYENYIKGFIDLNGKELTKYFNCDESEILLDDFEKEAGEIEEILYKVIVGDVNLTYDSGIKDIGKLEVVAEDCNEDIQDELEEKFGVSR